jgi:hypothetical protein
MPLSAANNHKIIILATFAFVLCVYTAFIFFSRECVNFSTWTFSDSEAAYYISKLRREGKLKSLEDQGPICSILPVYMRKPINE